MSLLGLHAATAMILRSAPRQKTTMPKGGELVVGDPPMQDRSGRRPVELPGERPRAIYVRVTSGTGLRTVRRAPGAYFYPEATVRPRISPAAWHSTVGLGGFRAVESAEGVVLPHLYLSVALSDRESAEALSPIIL